MSNRNLKVRRERRAVHGDENRVRKGDSQRHRLDRFCPDHFPALFECKSSEERVVYKKLNSTETLIQRTTTEDP